MTFEHVFLIVYRLVHKSLSTKYHNLNQLFATRERIYLSLHTIVPFHFISNKKRAKKDHESDWLDRAMMCKAKEKPPKMQMIPATLRVASRSHTPNLIFILISSLRRRLVVPLTGASGTLVSTVRVAARLAAAEADLRHFDGRGGALDWWEVGRGLLVVGG
jgi:hypothetical protein